MLALVATSCGDGLLPCTDCSYAVVLGNDVGIPVRYSYDDDPRSAKDLAPGAESGDLWSLPNTRPDGGPRRTIRAYATDGTLVYCASFVRERDRGPGRPYVPA